jgi:hypothetical protein
MPFKEITVNNANAIRTPQAIPCPEATDLDPDYILVRKRIAEPSC